MFFRSPLLFLVINICSLFIVEDTSAQEACNFSRGPIGELCSSAIYICGDKLDGFKGVLPDSLSAKQPWSALCNGNGTADNIIWFSFTPCSPRVCLEIVPFNCTTVLNGAKAYSGIQAGMYSGCDRNSWVACSDHTNDNGITTPLTLCYDNFVPGETAFLYLDGYANSVCEFTIHVLEGIDTIPIPSPEATDLEDGAITGKNIVTCSEREMPIRYNLTPPGDTVVFNSICQVTSEVDPSDSICFVWQVNPVAGRNFANQDSVGKFVDIVFSEPGTYTISATGFFHPYFGGSCANGAMGAIQSWKVTVLGPDTIVNAPIILCPGATASFCLPEIQISSDTLVYCQSDDCITVVQPYVFTTSKLNDKGVQYICSGSVYSFQGITYANNGVFEVLDEIDCSLKHRFEIQVIDIAAVVSTADLEINCKNPEITVSGIGLMSGNPLGGTIQYAWLGEDGSKLLDANSILLNNAGNYSLQTTLTAGNAICTDEVSFTVTADFNKPVITAQVPTITCKVNKANVVIQSSQPIETSQWLTPQNQIIQNAINIQVDSANCVLNKPYKLSVMALNGCITDTSFLIPVNFRRPAIQLQGDDLNCYNPIDTIQLAIDMIADSIIWSKVLPSPQGAFYGSFPIRKWLEVSTAGTYEARVRAMETGCWNVDSIAIGEDKAIPYLEAQEPLIWRCNTDKVTLTAITENGLPLNYYWSTTGGVLSGNISEKSIDAISPGTYDLQVTNIQNGCTKNQTISIIEDTNKPAEIDISITDISCFGKNDGVLQINDVSGGYEPYSFYLEGNPISLRTISGLSEGIYSIEVADLYDCKKTVNVQIQEPERLEISPSDTSLSVYITQDVDLTFSSNYPFDEFSSILWRDKNGVILGNDEQLVYQPSESGYVELIVITDNGCEERANIKVLVDKDLNILIPNIFSPNGDGINDRLIIYKNKIPAEISRMMIFDRYGNKVFNDDALSFNDTEVGWDGTLNGKPVESGVYVLVLEITDFQGVKRLIHKDLTILR